MKRLFSSLIFRLSLLFLVLSLIPVLVLVLFGTREIENGMSSFILQQNKTSTEHIVPLLRFLEKEDLVYLASGFLEKEGGFFILIDNHGNVSILNSTSKSYVPPYLDFYIHTLKNSIYSGVDADTVDYRNSVIVTVVPYGDDGYLVRFQDISTMKTIVHDTVVRIAFFVVMAILFATIVMGVLLYFIFAVPLKSLTAASENIARGNFDIDIDPDIMTGELSILADTFRFSAGKIKEGMLDLQETVEREKVNNRQIAALNRKLTTSYRQYKEIFNSAFTAIMIHDITGHVEDVNSTMVKMYGLHSREEALTYTILDYQKQGTDPAKIQSIIKKVMEEGEQIFEWKARRPLDDSVFDAQVSLRKVSFSENREYILANIVDITDRKTAEERLVRAQKLETVGSLAGGIAHDFNNILAGIMGPLSIIDFKLEKNGSIEKEQLKQYLDTMSSEGNRASDIVKQLLSIARKQKPQFVRMDLNETTRSVKAIAENSFDKSIHLVFKTYPGRAMISGDPAQMEQVLLNLAVNASHAMTFMKKEGEPWGGDLTVEVKDFTADALFCKTHPSLTPGKYYITTVEDMGVGMDQDLLRHIYNPFFTTKDKNGGTGLGLSMVYNLVSLHKGAVDVYSEKGKGSCFKVYIPAAQKDSGEKLPAPVKNAVENQNGTILVIDDEKTIRLTAREMLETAGYSVLLAENGTEALKILTQYSGGINLVLLDMAMPGMSGKEIFPKLKEIRGNIKVILSSGFQQDERVNAVLEGGADGFLQKPYSLHKLLEMVAGVLK